MVGPALFLLGAAGGHLYQMIAAGNFAPGNAGVIFYTDILIPLIGFALLWLQHRYGRERVDRRRPHGGDRERRYLRDEAVSGAGPDDLVAQGAARASLPAASGGERRGTIHHLEGVVAHVILPHLLAQHLGRDAALLDALA